MKEKCPSRSRLVQHRSRRYHPSSPSFLVARFSSVSRDLKRLIPDATTNAVESFVGRERTETGTLFPSELWWRDHYHDIESQGYVLRPRYHPNWEPSWRKSGKDFFKAEDGQPTLLPYAMDATCKENGKQVMLKNIPARRGQQELIIARSLSSPELRSERRNHCVPLLGSFDAPDAVDRKLVVMPYLRPFDKPHFRTYGEIAAFFTQICEGLQFMHERNIAHRDCTAYNIIFDPSEMYPEGFHPVKINRSKDFKGKPEHYDRTQRPSHYYLIDFGLSRQYNSRDASDEPLRGGDKSAPEHRHGRKCNPFHTDIYYLRNLVRERFMKVMSPQSRSVGRFQRYNGFEFMEALVDAMTDEDPGKRPAIEAVLEEFAAR
ncbi:kinase-like domain-containing protein [Russula earlei]|uniref:Kinase-like domain-containing protein n=1 Tax=Russula earlei TaxID=71964 RepID=A0ACC0UMX4_9AGAM|nr:kinase-like domain-containing protein [Russula earlei]